MGELEDCRQRNSTILTDHYFWSGAVLDSKETNDKDGPCSELRWSGRELVFISHVNHACLASNDRIQPEEWRISSKPGL